MNLAPQGGDAVVKENINSGVKEVKNNNAKDTVICGTLSERDEHIHQENWVPPPVEKEFSYPSDEEIVPNPKASFSKDFLHLGKVRN